MKKPTLVGWVLALWDTWRKCYQLDKIPHNDKLYYSVDGALYHVEEELRYYPPKTVAVYFFDTATDRDGRPISNAEKRRLADFLCAARERYGMYLEFENLVESGGQD